VGEERSATLPCFTGRKKTERGNAYVLLKEKQSVFFFCIVSSGTSVLVTIPTTRVLLHVVSNPV
jgi:hypothetical protein